MAEIPGVFSFSFCLRLSLDGWTGGCCLLLCVHAPLCLLFSSNLWFTFQRLSFFPLQLFFCSTASSTGLSFVSFSWPTIIISFCVLEPGAGYLQPTPQGFNSSFPLAAARIHMLHQQQPLVDFSTLTFLLQIFVFVLLPAAPYFPKYFPPSLLANNY